MKTQNFTLSYLAAFVSLAVSLPLSASLMRSDIDLQYYRDFAENKGRFTAGESNIEIKNKQGKSLGHLLNGVPMPDLSAANRNLGIATLVEPQYLVSVAHNTIYKSVEFGAAGDNPDAHHYVYHIVDRNDYDKKDGRTGDYHVPRLTKLVTEVVPTTVTNLGNDASIYHNHSRFSHFVRLGSGRQILKSSNHKENQIAKSYTYLTGGVHLPLSNSRSGSWLEFRGSNLTGSPYGALATFGTRGDSGSGIYVYDKQEKRWLLVAIYAQGTPNNNYYNRASIIRQDYHNAKVAEDVAGTLDNRQKNTVFEWTASGKNSTLSGSSQKLAVPLADRSIKDNSASPKGYGDTPQILRPQENTGKTLNINGQDTTIVLKTDIDQGAGALNFNTNATVRPENDQTWLGAGVIVAKGKQVTWQVKNPQGDRLSKLGEGTLYINGKGENLGDISVGQGTVILNQQADEKGKKSAFNQVGIVSGRSTVVLNTADQVDPNNIYFGFRGGRLDLNGNHIVFNRIQNTDDGAKIVNHSKNRAMLTIHGSKTTEIKHDTFNGFIGETDVTKPNGQLDLVYDPQHSQSFYTFSGGLNLNGELTANGGTLLLSGRPTPHAYDVTNKRDVIYADDWQNRQFKANRINARQDAQIYVGRNVSDVVSHFSAVDKGRLHLGVINANTPSCYYSEYSGQTHCESQEVMSKEIFDSLPTTKIRGNVRLADSAQLQLGKANLQGSIQAGAATTVRLSDQATWTNNGNSRIGHLVAKTGSVINLNDKFASNAVPTRFNRLIIDGNFNGQTKINYLTNIGSGQGDHVRVNGIASGELTLALRNSGKESNSVSPLSLLTLANPAQKQQAKVVLENGYVDLGAYRYVLANHNNDYRLYNPLKDAQNRNPSALSTINTEEVAKVTAEADKQRKTVERLNVETEKQRQAEQAANQSVSAAKAKLNTANTELSRLKQYADYYRVYYPSYYKQLQANLTAAKKKVDQANVAVTQASQNAKSLADKVKAAEQAAENAKNLAQQLEDKLVALKANKNDHLMTEALKLCQENGANCEQLEAHADVEESSEVATLATDSNRRVSAEQAQSVSPSDNASSDVSAQVASLTQMDSRLEQPELDNANAVIEQSQWVSQYANTALSEVSAQVTNLIQIGQGLDRQLGHHNNKFAVWSSIEHQQTQHKSTLYRPYKQNANLTQIGLDIPLSHSVNVGTVISKNRSNTDFDENASGKSTVLTASIYAKWRAENGLFVSLDASHGQAKNQINLGGEERFKRDITAVGMNAGHQFELGGINVQPNIGARYYRLGGKSYQLGGADVDTRTIHFMSYQAGLKVSKTFELAEWQLEPSLATHYVDANSKRIGVNINQNRFEQRFGRYMKTEAKLGLEHRRWQFSLHGGLLKGNEIQRQHFAGVKVGHTW